MLPPSLIPQAFEKVAGLLQAARRVLFITGAGVSAESGIPTFRGATQAFDNGLTEEGPPFEEVLSGPTFIRNPKLSWKYFFLMEQGFRGKAPNPAHGTIAALEKQGKEIWVATQNIDGLHQSAGSRQVIELHGNLRWLICTRCDYRAYHETFAGLPPVPGCPRCQATLRPDVVLYEEMLPEAALDRFYAELDTGFDLVFSVGTTSIFPYVTGPVMVAARRGAATVEINPEETPISDQVRFRFRAPAGTVLTEIAKHSTMKAGSRSTP